MLGGLREEEEEEERGMRNQKGE